MAVVRDWDNYWRDQVWLVATMSTCLTRGTGAVVVRDRRSIATGFNGNVPGAVHCVDGGCIRCEHRIDRATLEQRLRATAAADQLSKRLDLGPLHVAAGADLDTCTCVHAEANAIAQCARYGVATHGTTIYCTTRPCLDCVKLIAVSGVVTVVYDQEYPSDYEVPPTVAMRRFHE